MVTICYAPKYYERDSVTAKHFSYFLAQDDCAIQYLPLPRDQKFVFSLYHHFSFFVSAFGFTLFAASSIQW